MVSGEAAWQGRHACVSATAAGGLQGLQALSPRRWPPLGAFIKLPALRVVHDLFGRPQYRLSHVLVSEDFETHQDFFYIPPTPHELDIKDRSGHLIKRISTADAQIHLADIPFIRLQGVRSEWLPGSGHSYSDFVQQAQEDLNLLDSSHELRLK